MRYELITTARRGRYYLARVAYGLFLLVMLWAYFRDWEYTHPAGGSIQEVNGFAEQTFILFAEAALHLALPASRAGGGRDRRRTPAEDAALLARQPALEGRDHPGQAGRG